MWVTEMAHTPGLLAYACIQQPSKWTIVFQMALSVHMVFPLIILSYYLLLSHLTLRNLWVYDLQMEFNEAIKLKLGEKNTLFVTFPHFRGLEIEVQNC